MKRFLRWVEFHRVRVALSMQRILATTALLQDPAGIRASIECFPAIVIVRENDIDKIVHLGRGRGIVVEEIP